MTYSIITNADIARKQESIVRDYKAAQKQITLRAFRSRIGGLVISFGEALAGSPSSRRPVSALGRA